MCQIAGRSRRFHIDSLGLLHNNSSLSGALSQYSCQVAQLTDKASIWAVTVTRPTATQNSPFGQASIWASSLTNSSLAMNTGFLVIFH